MSSNVSDASNAGWKSRVLRRFSVDDAAQRWSDIYSDHTDDLEASFFRERRDVAIGHVLSRCPEDVPILDLGCGAGPITAALRTAGRPVYPLDCSPDMLALARERIARTGVSPYPLLQGDSEALPFADDSFGCVVCLGVISYLDDYSAMLREVVRVMKPGGFTVVTTRNSRNPAMWDPVRLAGRALRARRLIDEEGDFPGRPLDPQRVEADLIEAGLSIDRFEGIGFGPVRFRGRLALGLRASLVVDGLFRRLSRIPGFGWLGYGLADVNLWICRKPAAAGAGARP